MCGLKIAIETIILAAKALSEAICTLTRKWTTFPVRSHLTIERENKNLSLACCKISMDFINETKYWLIAGTRGIRIRMQKPQQACFRPSHPSHGWVVVSPPIKHSLSSATPSRSIPTTCPRRTLQPRTCSGTAFHSLTHFRTLKCALRNLS